jgi:hypothetical protein
MPDSTNTPLEPDTKKKRNRKKQERKFLGNDADFLAFSRVKHKLFTDRLADFTAFDPDFDATYAANWLAKIKYCEAITSDETTMREMASVKSDLQQKVLEVIAHLSKLEYYALDAFKNDPEILHEFQFNKVNSLYQYKVSFIIDGFVIQSLAYNEYNAPLTAVGMPATLLIQLTNLLQEAATLEISHEKFKRIRIMRTRLRIKDMNALYDFYEKVRLAAQIIYADKPEVAGVFAM